MLIAHAVNLAPDRSPSPPTRRSAAGRMATAVLGLALAGAATTCQKDNVVSPPPLDAVSASRSALVAAPDSIAAGGPGSTITVTARDTAGQAIAGATVVLSATGTGVTLTQPAGPTNASGVATGSLASTTAGTKTVSATVDGVALAQTAGITVTATTADSVSASRSTVTAAPDSITAGGAGSTITVTARDTAGHAIAGATVVLSATGTGVTLTQPAGPTNASGVGAGSLTATTAGTDTVTATIDGVAITQAAAVTVRAGGGTLAGHVFIVVEENTGYGSVIGNASMPYLNGLAQQYGLATQYYADTHPSIGNYFMLTTGTVVSNDDNYSSVVTTDNVVRELIAAGKTWKDYAEDLPSVGYTGGDTGNYAREHNVIALLSDVVNDSTQRRNLVPFSQFATDLAAGTLPAYSMIVPNLCDDAHDCSLATADGWLQTNIAPLLASAAFQQDGLLIITFDEASDSDTSHGGGKVAWIVVSPKAKTGYQSTTLYQHQSTLRLMLQALGVTAYPNAAATAPDMTEFFNP
jgi:phosphatidylinositol-3-phosphatase